ncbi:MULTISPECIES: DUF4259 domain-containing protein [Streptomyces]|uniref:DUF4259 domain-containing protein n=1 Tax=Streptomyces TaxID=1883 RepID=UPI00278C202F|nr:DUF4259 domain-containing protein [Streptomyces hydrogenans]
MGAWGTGPFDDDTAADFANTLDAAEPEAREGLIRGVLARTIDATGYLTDCSPGRDRNCLDVLPFEGQQG